MIGGVERRESQYCDSRWGDAAHRESSTFPCIGDAVMPAAWPLAYCPPDAFALPAVGTQGTQAFLRKARWWVSEANPDEVEHRGSAEVYHTNDIRRGSPHKRYPPRCAAATQNIGYPPSLPAGAATPCHLNSPPRSACLSVCASLHPPKNHKKGTEKTFRPLVVQLASFSAVVSASFAGAECPPFALRGRRLRR